MIKYLLFLTSLTLTTSATFGQTIFKNWYSQSCNLCLTIDSSSATLNDLTHMKVKQKDRQFIITEYYWTMGIAFWRHKENHYFNIDKLTTDTLILSRNLNKKLWEYMPDSITIFTINPDGCSDKWKIIKSD
jgi:hypothetical protein